jgi:hypothetical protein
VTAAARIGRCVLGAAAPCAAATVPWRAWPSHRLRTEQIRTRVVGRDITDDFHWTEYYRSDGVIVSFHLGHPGEGQWRIEHDMLCVADRPGADFECLQVWVSGDEVSLRAYDADQPHTAFIRPHRRG